MFRVSNFAKFAASAKNAMTSRDAASTAKNLEVINAAVIKMTDTVSSYTGGLLAANGISSQSAQLEVDIKNGIADVKKSEPVNEDESKEIMAYIEEVLEPNIKKNIAALIAKKDELAKANLQGTVLGDMKDLRNSTNAFGAAMAEKAPASLQAEAKKLNDKVDAAFEEGIRYFS